MAGSMLVAQPQPVISGTPISYSSFSQPVSVANTSPPAAAAVVLTTPITTDVCITSTASLPVIQNGTVSIAPSTLQSATPNLNSTITDATPSIKCKPEVKPVVPLGSVISNTPTPEANIASLEKCNFNRDLILEAIDKLRDRKARPDMERISCLLRRQHNIPPSDTQICLNRLAEVGAVVCVDYKGNLSYRNPTKWRKTATSTGTITNRPNISKRLIEAVRSLIPEGGDPNQSFTLFQIEQALKQLKPSVPSTATPGENEGDASSAAAPIPELTGSNLRVCMEREAIFGKLAKLPDGRFVLDENGDRKRNTGPAIHFNRRPFLGKLPPQGTFGKPPIAPALDSIGGKSYSVLSIAPGRPLARRPPFTTGKRGRPPSIKAKKMLTSCSQQPILPAPPDNLMTPPLEKASLPIHFISAFFSSSCVYARKHIATLYHLYLALCCCRC
ncbi:Atherin [Taenia solium]|eukprot:TsM_000851600 transcript=TsM_000851600 gene=TsM_000851600